MDNKLSKQSLKNFLCEIKVGFPLKVMAKNEERAKEIALEYLINAYGDLNWQIEAREE